MEKLNHSICIKAEQAQFAFNLVFFFLIKRDQILLNSKLESDQGVDLSSCSKIG